MAIWSNRILIFLGAVGIFLSGVLSYSAWKHMLVPCGGTLNCSFVLQSEFANFAGVNVSYIGLLGYVGLFAIAVLRSSQVGAKFKALSVIGFVMSIIGLLFSLYLTYVSIAMLKLTCAWCLTSLGTVLASVIMHAALLQSKEPKEKDKLFGMTGACASLIIALGVAGYVIKNQEKDIDMVSSSINAGGTTIEQMLPVQAKVRGDNNAKVTVIEFVDINCPVCRTSYPLVKDILNKYDKGLRMGFRHFPLMGTPGHETSLQASIISEYAAEENDFWKYMDYVMDKKNQERIKTFDGLLAVAGELGHSRGELSMILSPIKTDKAQTDRSQELLERVGADMTLGVDMGVKSTPMFIIYAEGHPPKPVSFNQLEITLMSSPYRELISSAK